MNRSAAIPKEIRRLPSGRIPRAAIRRYVDQIVERFQPERVILFGSHAYGQPNADSDVDLLVVMPARGMMEQAVRIRSAIDAPFALDLLVRTPQFIDRRLAIGDWFLREILERGIVLHEAKHARMVSKGRP